MCHMLFPNSNIPMYVFLPINKNSDIAYHNDNDNGEVVAKHGLEEWDTWIGLKNVFSIIEDE